MHIDLRQWHRERDEFNISRHLRVREPALGRNDSRISTILRAFLSSEIRRVPRTEGNTLAHFRVR